MRAAYAAVYANEKATFLSCFSAVLVDCNILLNRCFKNKKTTG
jgi:hypothetical protein